MSIKHIQEQLGVVADGLWGNLSHTALTQALQQGKVIKASNNFTVNELLHSDKAVDNGIENLPSLQDFKNLINTVAYRDWEKIGRASCRERVSSPV